MPQKGRGLVIPVVCILRKLRIPISNTSATKVPEEIEAWRSRPAKRPSIYLPIELSSGKKSKAISTSAMNSMVTMVVLAE